MQIAKRLDGGQNDMTQYHLVMLIATLMNLKSLHGCHYRSRGKEQTMIKWLILGGLVGIGIKEMIHTAHLYSDSLDDILKEIDDE